MVRAGSLFQAFNLSCTFFIPPFPVANMSSLYFPRLRWRQLEMVYLAFLLVQKTFAGAKSSGWFRQPASWVLTISTTAKRYGNFALDLLGGFFFFFFVFKTCFLIIWSSYSHWEVLGFDLKHTAWWLPDLSVVLSLLSSILFLTHKNTPPSRYMQTARSSFDGRCCWHYNWLSNFLLSLLLHLSTEV